MLSGKQRSELKKLALELRPTVMIGKDEITPTVVAAIEEYLDAHELVKVQVLESALIDTKDAANEIAEMIGAEYVQAIGNRFVLYRPAKDPDKRKIILL